MADLVLEVVEAAGATPRVMLLSFDWRGLCHLRQHYPAVATGWLTQRMSEAERGLWWSNDNRSHIRCSPAQAVALQGGRCWLPEFSELRNGDVASAHTLGLEVIPWGVDRCDEMQRAIEWEADGLITDRPDLAMNPVALRKP
jgi:glycerophosphoryl diester phosphodiesterase